MWKTSLAQLRAHAGRLFASCLAIVIAVGFVVATLVLGDTTNATMTRAVAAQYVDTDAVVLPDPGGLDQAFEGPAGPPSGPSLGELAQRVADADGVAAIAADSEAFIAAQYPGSSGSQYVTVESVAADQTLRWQRLSDGDLPLAVGEVAVSASVGAEVGDEITVTIDPVVVEPEPEPGAEPAPVVEQVTVVGVVDLSGDPTAALGGRFFAAPEQVARWGGMEPTQLRVAATAGTDVQTLIGSLRTVLDDAGYPGIVRTGVEQAAVQVSGLTGNSAGLTTILLVFGAIAVFVAGLVIANTFSVLLAQRTRELALLRCVGATARQVRRGVLVEAAITGLAASVLGVGVGVALAAGVSSVAGGGESLIPLGGLSVRLHAVIIGLIVGTLVTVLSALAPSRAATRIAPLAALRPMDNAPLRSRRGLIRLAFGLAMFVPGVAILVLGVVIGQIIVALPGGMLSALGALLLLQRAIPPVVAVAGRLISRCGVPARLAAGNASRNPRRTAATATALLIGVTLTTAFLVGAASTRTTAEADLNESFPTDVIVRTFDAAMPDTLPDQLAAVDGVDSGTALLQTDVTGPDGTGVEVFGVDLSEAAGIVRSAELLPSAGVVVVSRALAGPWGIAEADPVTFDLEGRSVTLDAHLVSGPDVLMSREDLLSLDPTAGVQQIWLRVSDGLSAEESAQVVEEVTDLASQAVPAVEVSGAIGVRQALNSILDGLLLVVTGLLGIAVVIALIGVGNTLALSVIERRQENGLVRALGLTRRQLRGLLAWEALLVAGVAAVLGVVAGSLYGLAGTAALLGAAGPVILDFPVLQVLAVVVAATAAGVLASVLPARRAARASPVAAIAG